LAATISAVYRIWTGVERDSANDRKVTIMNKDFQILMERSDFAGPIAVELIESVESKLSVRFPNDYRSFLRQYGAVVGHGFEIAGIYTRETNDEPPMWRSVLDIAESFRRSSNDGIPESLIPISDNGMDLTYYLDTAGIYGDMGAVIAFGPGCDTVVISDNFVDFVLRLGKKEL
jgi:cell wall assembly regulator SMI1